MDRIATENLFLLEFLVDKVELTRCECDDPKGATCVSFQFLDNAPLDVCEDDFASADLCGDDSNVKSGKSCLFSLTPQQAEDATRQFDIEVAVFKKMQPGWLPEKVQIGTTLISVVNVFNELIDSIGCGCDTSPCAKTLKDTFKIADTTGSEIGNISVYIRMSCFGKLIVTQFQMNLDDKSVLFKDKEGHSLYRYKKASKSPDRTASQYNSQCPDVPCPRPGAPYGGGGGYGGPGGNVNTLTAFPPGGGGGMGGMPNYNCPTDPCGPGGFGQAQQQPPAFNTPCNECGQPMGGGGQQGGFQTPCNECGQPMGGMMGPPPGGFQTPCIECSMPPPCPPPAPPAEDPNAAYQEIGAQMGNNALTIRVHKDSNRAERVDQQKIDDGCTCIQQPGMDVHSYSLQPPLNTGGDGRSPFNLKMGGNGNGNVTVVPPVCTSPDGTQYTELSDPDRDVFILRIGKKSEGADRKSNLELELCTPKGPDLKPIPKKETRDTQYDPADAGDAGGGGKGKGKGGKKGKKK